MKTKKLLTVVVLSFILMVASATAGEYFFHLHDHLGNTRVVVDVDKNVVERYDYYPFGLVSRSSVSSEIETIHKFTGKELDDEHGVELYYFGARYHDPVTGRFVSVDPLAELYSSWSPYSYTFNNPVNNLDPDGRGVVSLAVKAARKAFSKKVLQAARRKAVRNAWAQERQLLKEHGITTMKLSARERNELLTTGKIKGWIGHHVNSVKDHSLEMAMDPSNVKFVKGIGAHLNEHTGNWQNKTTGPLIDRLSQLSGPALLVFFLNYEKKMQELANESPLISDPNSLLSYINPYNYLVENIALLEAITAAEQVQSSNALNKKKRKKRDDFFKEWDVENQGPPR